MKRILAILLILTTYVNTPWAQENFDFDALSDSIQAILDSTGAPGAQIAIFSGDSTLWMGNFGYADKSMNKKVNDKTFFRIGSVTKNFVSTAILQLVEDGQLRLNDEVRQLVPDVYIKNTYGDDHPILIEHLMEHTAGFDDMHMKEYAAYAEGWALEEGINFHPHNRYTRWQPGTHMSYCNSGPPLAAYILERVTGQDFEEYVRQHIFQPLGMVHTSFVLTPEVSKRLSKGYSDDGQTEADYWHISQRPAGSINSNAEEMARFVRMLMNRGRLDTVRILNPSSIERMERCETTLAGKSGVPQGYGLHNYVTDYKGIEWHGHDGGMMGFIAKATYSPEYDIGFVAMVNCTNGAMGQINRLLYRKLSEGFGRLTVPEQKEISKEDEDKITGYYASATSRNQVFRIADIMAGGVKVDKDENGFFVRGILGGEKTRGTVVNENQLLLEDNRGYRSPMVFANHDGVLYAQQVNWMTNLRKSSFIMAYLPITLGALTVLSISMLILWGLIWMPMRAFGKWKKGRWSLRYLPMFIMSSLGLFLLSFVRGMEGNILANLGSPTIYSIGMFASAWLAVIFMIIFVWIRVRVRKEEERGWYRVFTLIASVLFIVAILFLFRHGFVGKPIWMY